MTSLSETSWCSELQGVDSLNCQQVFSNIAARAERLQLADVADNTSEQEAYLCWVMSRLKNLSVPAPNPACWQDHPQGANVRVFRQPVGCVEFCYLQFGPNGSIPYHDHGDSNGVMRIIGGSVVSTSFTIVEQSSATMTLNASVRVCLSAGDMTSFCLQRNNVHALTAGPDGAFVLDVFTRLNDDACCRYLQLQPRSESGLFRAVWSWKASREE